MAADPEYTLVLGLDRRHLRQLQIVWPTWRRHKPSITEVPLLIFYDHAEIDEYDIRQVTKRTEDAIYFPWPCPGVHYDGDPASKWYHPQRYKMLAGFVHVPALHCLTEYYLKIDTDAVAMGQPDWIDPRWFENDPSIIAPPWGYCKPADQIDRLDDWVRQHKETIYHLARYEPLRMHARPGSDMVRCERIISNVAFFNTAFTKFASKWANQTCGEHKLPVPSQDGYLWYLARRQGLLVRRVPMKPRGWQVWNTEANIKQAAITAMET